MPVRRWRLIRFPLAVAAATIGWLVGFALSFVPAQTILADPAIQSGKMIAVFASIEPLPRISSPGALILLVALVSVFLVLGYHVARPDPAQTWSRRGLRFGSLAWLLMVPWFELYLPWNVLHEPIPLILLEAACWWITLSCAGLGIALAHGVRKPLP